MSCTICAQSAAESGMALLTWERELLGCTCPPEGVQQSVQKSAVSSVPLTGSSSYPAQKSRTTRRSRRGATEGAPYKKKQPIPRREPWVRLDQDPSLGRDDVASWEEFDAAALFDETPRLHANKVTYIDDPVGDDASSGVPESGHEDEVTVGPGTFETEADEQELQADVEEGTPPEAPSAGAESVDEPGDSEGEPSGESEDLVPDAAEEPVADGAEDPIQKEPEGVEEVAEATSKTSEDVHGGDEATKDIEDSPNAANDGQNPENNGAEAGKGGEEGASDGESGVEGESDAAEQSADEGWPFAPEDWEDAADHSALSLALPNSLDELAAKVRQEEGHRTSMPTYEFDREESPVELEVALKKGRELIQRLAAEENLAERVHGSARWDAKRLARAAVSYRHPQIPTARFDRPKVADIVLLLDISGSCQRQAEMFMAIAAGAVGDGVRVHIGYNGSARCRPLEPPRRQLRTYAQAKAWVQSEVEKTAGWENAGLGEWSFGQFAGAVQPKTCIIFGDWDGIDQYQSVCHLSKFRSTRFFWFANEGVSRGRCETADDVPSGWTRKNYFPSIYRPQDLVTALRKVR